MAANCHCKGVRACAVCEHSRTAGHRLNLSRIGRAFVFCPRCSLCVEVDQKLGQLRNGMIRLAGVQIAEETISLEEEHLLEQRIEATPWVESQSGRQKQDFGPKVNFKKQKVKTDSFAGFPSYMDIVLRSFSRLPSCKSFQPVELCNLKYSPEKGSCIDPHFDDWWLWGERLVTLNITGSTVLTFSQAEDFADLTQVTDDQIEYSLTTQTLYDISRKHECYLPFNKNNVNDEDLKAQRGDIVHVVLPRRSVVLVEGEARFQWHHSVLREHIQETRLALTCRELSNTFLNPNNGNEYLKGQELLSKAKINPMLP